MKKALKKASIKVSKTSYKEIIYSSYDCTKIWQGSENYCIELNLMSQLLPHYFLYYSSSKGEIGQQLEISIFFSSFFLCFYNPFCGGIEPFQAKNVTASRKRSRFCHHKTVATPEIVRQLITPIYTAWALQYINNLAWLHMQNC